MRQNLKNLKAAFVVAVLLMGAALSSAFAKENRYEWGWCTWFACDKFNQYAPEPGVTWWTNAGTWLDQAAAKGWETTTSSASPIIGSVMVWTSTSGGAGHVAVVTQTWNGGFRVSEMNVGARDTRQTDPEKTLNFGIQTTRDFLTNGDLNRYAPSTGQRNLDFKGFILPRMKQQPGMTLEQRNQQAVADMQALRGTDWKFGNLVNGNIYLNQNWDPQFELRYAQFYYIYPAATWVYHATYKSDPKVRFTIYQNIYTGQWIGWNRVK